MTTTQVRIAAAAAFAVLGFAVTAQVAKADTTTDGTPATVEIVTSPTGQNSGSVTVEQPGAASSPGSSEAGGGAATAAASASAVSEPTSAPATSENGGSDNSTEGDGTTILDVTFEGSIDDVNDLVDAIMNDPADDADIEGGEDGEADDPDIDPGTDPSSNSQLAQAAADASQANAGNVNIAAGINQPGNHGAVTQRNDVTAIATGAVSGIWGSGTGSAGSNDPNATAAAKAAQTGASNTNTVVLVNSDGDVGDITQSNDVYAGAQATGTAGGASAGANGAATVPTGNESNGAITGDASAGGQPTKVGHATAQATQSRASNVNVIVRVNSDGDNGTVTQTNTVSAAAGATVPGASAGDAGAGASKGPFGTDQSVTTSGSATARNTGDLIQEIEQLEDSKGRPGEATRPGAATSVPAAGLTDGTAAASQSGALNANVSVRVGSSGSDGAVHQGNNATATGTSADQSIVTVTGGSNVNVAVVIPGPASGAPQGPWTWNWNWDGAWTLPPSLGANVAPTSSSIWDWIWQASQSGPGSSTPGLTGAAVPGLTGTATTGSATTASNGAGTTTPTTTPAAPYGTWTWNWTWLLADGTSWSLDWSQACECAWDWNWTWDWSKQAPTSQIAPDTTASGSATAGAGDGEPAERAFDPAIDTGPVTQTNSVSAEATSTVTLNTLSETTLTQTGSDPAGETQDASADQRILNSQTAKSQSQSAQSDARNENLTWGVPVESVLQWNEVEATATAAVAATISQGIVQEQSGNGTTEQDMSAEQWTLNSQLAQAATQSAQQSAYNINTVAAPSPKHAAVGAVQQSNSVSTTASSTVETDIAQWIGQFQDAGDATSQEADALQLHINQQQGLAVAQAATARTTNLNDVDVPKGSRATNPTVGQANAAFVETSSDDKSSIDAWIHQGQGGAADWEAADATQQGIVGQKNNASAPAQQADIANRAFWAGVEPPPEPTPEDNPPDDNPGGDNPGGDNPGGDNPGGQQPPTITPGGPTDDGGNPGKPEASPPTGTATPLGPAGGTGKSSPRGSGEPNQGDDGHRSNQDEPSFATPDWGFHQNAPSEDDGKNTPGGPSNLPPTPPPAPTPPQNTPAGGAGGPSPGPKAETAKNSAASGASGPPKRGKHPVHFPPPGQEDGSTTGSGGSAPPSGGGGGFAVLGLGRYEIAPPEGLGVQEPTLILGRSGAFVEPFEWPG